MAELGLKLSSEQELSQIGTNRNLSDLWNGETAWIIIVGKLNLGICAVHFSEDQFHLSAYICNEVMYVQSPSRVQLFATP